MSSDMVGTLLLVRARTGVETELLESHVALLNMGGLRHRVVELPRTDQAVKVFADLLKENWEVQPLGVLWRPGEKGGRRRADTKELLRGVNPYRPKERQQAAILKRSADRALVVEAESASVAAMREAWTVEGNVGSDPEGIAFAAHVVRRARLSLERAERRVLGPIYKSPRLVKEEILASQRFHQSLARLSDEVGAEKVSLAKAEEFLAEMATGWSRLAADLVPAIGRRTFEKGFDPQIDLVPEEVARLRGTLAEKASIFLWSHRSNMDQPVLTLALYDEGMPMPHTFAGINMAFGPVGPLYRRAGAIFIRRDIGNDPLYKHVLQEFVGYLVERRFDLSWSIEGTRSRTGKMLPPKLGLLAYASKAYLDGRTDDIALQPVSISFDQLDEIEEYAKYARGAAKKAEGMGWLVDYLRSQSKRHYGKAYVRFPEPVSMRQFLGDPSGEVAQDTAKRRLALQKMAFEVAWRINQATPVTPTALVSSVLLGSRGLGLSVRQMHAVLQPTLDHVERVGLPQACGVASLRTVEGVEAALDALTTGGPVTALRSGRTTVWLIEAKNQLAATFYRNSIIHVFLNRAIVEVASLAGALAGERGQDPVAEFWGAAWRLRDLLKFEFYFNDKEDHQRDLAAEMASLDPQWETLLGQGVAAVSKALTVGMPLTASFTIRPFLEAYAIVADVLASHQQVPEKKTILTEALGLGEQYIAQRRITNSEPVSTLLFDTALQLFTFTGLLEEAPDRVARTQQALAELQGILRLILEVERAAEDAYLIRGASVSGAGGRQSDLSAVPPWGVAEIVAPRPIGDSD